MRLLSPRVELTLYLTRKVSHNKCPLFAKARRRDERAPCLLADGAQRVALFRERYQLLLQRLTRSELFSTGDALGGDAGSHVASQRLTPIKNLSGRGPGEFTLFGMLNQLREGQYHLEDLDGSIVLRLGPATVLGRGLFTLNTFVLVRGRLLENRTFAVELMGGPPPEPRARTLAAYGHEVDFFGAPKETDDVETVRHIELAAEDVLLVVLADVWLDQPKVLAKLKLMLDGYAANLVPLAFVFMGNFSSTPYIYSSESAASYRRGWRLLSMPALLVDLLICIPVPAV